MIMPVHNFEKWTENKINISYSKLKLFSTWMVWHVMKSGNSLMTMTSGLVEDGWFAQSWQSHLWNWQQTRSNFLSKVNNDILYINWCTYCIMYISCICEKFLFKSVCTRYLHIASHEILFKQNSNFAMGALLFYMKKGYITKLYP